MDTMHLKYPLVLFVSESSALPLFLLSPRIIMLCHCSSTMTKDHFLIIFHGTKCPLCVGVPLNTHSFIHTALLNLPLVAGRFVMQNKAKVSGQVPGCSIHNLIYWHTSETCPSVRYCRIGIYRATKITAN